MSDKTKTEAFLEEMKVGDTRYLQGFWLSELMQTYTDQELASLREQLERYKNAAVIKDNKLKQKEDENRELVEGIWAALNKGTWIKMHDHLLKLIQQNKKNLSV